MPIYVKSGKELVYIHIPKCGGTSIRSLLKKLSKFEYLYHAGKKSLPCSPQHFHAELLNILMNKRGVESFAVVRHPLSRIISEYYYREKKGRIDSGLGLDEFIVKAIRGYSKNAFIYDNHIRPMHQFLFDSTRVFRLEDGLKDVFSHIHSFFNAKEDLDFNPNVSKNQGSYQEVEISRESIELVNDFYHVDFNRLNYTPLYIEEDSIALSQLKVRLRELSQ
jgi:hypothetical protein